MAETLETADGKTLALDSLEAAHEEFALSIAAFSEQRTREEEDERFEAGNHWTDADLAWKKEKHAPVLVMDQLSPQVDKVANQPVHQIVVTAVGKVIDPKAAELAQGNCRRVERLSGAEDIYKYARRSVLVRGRGFWRVRADIFTPIEFREDGQYDASVFTQDLRIETILNQASVHPDPRCRTLDFSDMRFCYIVDDLEWSEFRRLYPKAQRQTHDAMRGLFTDDQQSAAWFNVKTQRVAERYYIEDKEVALCVLKAGTVLQPGSMPLGTDTVVVKDKGTPAYPEDAIRTERTFKIPQVKWMKLTAGEILEGPLDVPGRYIPVVQIVGGRRMVDGKYDFRGMVRMAKDPQRLVNFFEERLASTVDLSSYDTWLFERRSVADPKDYTDAHKNRPGGLAWDSTPPEGETERLPAPVRINGGANVAPIAVAAQRASMSLRGILGVPDVTPDEMKPEQSGRAIRARQQEQTQTTSHYADSTAAGIRHTARIILSMGRQVWDVPQILRINGLDEKAIDVVAYAGQHKSAALQMQAEGGIDPKTKQAIRQLYQVDTGEFDIAVTAGKGYQTGRQEAVETLTEIMPIMGPDAKKALPVLLRNSDFPGAQELANTIAPEDDANMVPKEQAMQAQMVIDQQTQIINQLQQEKQAKAQELASEEKIAADANATKLEVERIKAANEYALEQIKIAAEIQKAEIASRQAVAVASLRPQPTNASPEFGV